jgi:HEAT repeat protein
MSELEKLEARWKELFGRPNTKQEIDEVLSISKKMEILKAKEHQELTDELADIGIKIVSIYTLVNTKAKYPKAIPILIKHLQKKYSDATKQGIIRALTVKEAKGVAVPLLIKEYLKTPKEKEDLRWVIGNAVWATITKADAESIFPIVLDKTNGWSREGFIFALSKIREEKVKNVLIQVMDDNDKVIREAVKKVLKKML